jgi:hypothetical protein
MKTASKIVANIPPAPEGQQGLPMRAAASDSWRSLRSAHGPLPLTSGTASRRSKHKEDTRKLDENREH